MIIKSVKLFKGDIIIILSVLLSAVILFIFMIPKEYSHNILEIYLDGELINSITLEKDSNFSIEIDEFVHNTIEINDSKVKVTNSTCFDHVCENTGYIEKPGEVIVCIPNKLLLKIVGSNSNDSYDAIVG